MEAPLTLRLFGPMHVCIGDAPLAKMRSRKALWLLALLSTRANRPVARQWIASTLWPDADLATAFANLRPVLSDLRQALGEHGERIQSLDRNTILLDLAGVDHDVARFDAAMRKTDFAHAVDLYRGSFLEGCTEEWVPQEREMRENECLRALQTLGEEALQSGDYERALIHFNRAVVLDVWRDAPRRGQMQALAKMANVNAALQVYREFAHLLSAKAAMQPDPATTALYRQLRAYAASRTSAARPTASVSSFLVCESGSLGIPERTYRFDSYRFVPKRQLLLHQDLPVRVGARALDLLDLLIQRAGDLVGKDELLRYGWPEAFVHENNLMVNIAALRRALASPSGLPYIVTVPGRGYRFAAPVRIEAQIVTTDRYHQVNL